MHKNRNNDQVVNKLQTVAQNPLQPQRVGMCTVSIIINTRARCDHANLCEFITAQNKTTHQSPESFDTHHVDSQSSTPKQPLNLAYALPCAVEWLFGNRTSSTLLQPRRAQTDLNRMAVVDVVDVHGAEAHVHCRLW